MVPTYFRRELRDRALQRRSRLRTFPIRASAQAAGIRHVAIGSAGSSAFADGDGEL